MNRLKLISILLVLTMAILPLVSCNTGKKREIKASHADSVIFAAGAIKQYERMLELTDSFEMSGDISPLDANRWRGVYYYRQGQYRMSEICYRKALDCKVESEQDQLSYNKITRRLSELLLVRGDYEGSLQVAIPAVKKMDETGIGSDIDYAILLNNIGCCQLNLGQDKEANVSFLTARGHYANRWQSDSTSRGFQEAVIGTVYTSQAYINTRRYAESIYWIDRTEMLLGKYKQRDYLMVAKRYREAADNYRYLDKALGDWGMEESLDNIQLYILPKYQANAQAGRGDSAMVIGRHIMSVLDSAITGQKNSATAELATIYDTQGKEAEIAQREMDLSHSRLVATAVMLILLIIFFTVYTLHKRKSAHRLAAAHGRLEEAHAKLQTAYDQLEKTTKAKERIESELRIARNIQMSMVPNIFPDIDGIDLYAAMTPAKEVGGDLYGYLLQGDELYFCVGDVSGKGVPASLFMAQATRLFRSLAAQHMMPAEICTRMNNALTEDNEQGMFVTMFMGLIHLKTGRMDFCNAGHNPPLLNVPPHFMEMESNAPIGLWPGIDFVGETLENVKGIPILVYTDGLNEAENQEQEQFGDERLIESLSGKSLGSAKAVVEYLRAEVEKHRNGAEMLTGFPVTATMMTAPPPTRLTRRCRLVLGAFSETFRKSVLLDDTLQKTFDIPKIAHIIV